MYASVKTQAQTTVIHHQELLYKVIKLLLAENKIFAINISFLKGLVTIYLF